MDGHGGPRFENLGNTVRRKRSQTFRRPRPEAQPFIENRDKSPSSSTPTPPSDDVSKVSSDENTVGDGNSKRKVFHLNQCASTRATGVVGEHAGNKNKKEDGAHNAYGNGGVTSDGLGNENRLKKVKLKVGGVTRTIQTKSNSQGVSSSGVSTKSSRSSDALRQRPKLILQGNSDEDNSPPPDKKSGLQGIPWKDFSRGGFNIGKESSSMGRTSHAFGNQGEKSERVRKSKRVPKKRALDTAFDEDEDDDEIRYLEKLKTSKVAIKEDEESSLKHRSLSRVSKDGKRLKSERVPEDMDYEEEEEHVSDLEVEGKKKLSDSPTESRREMALTTRQRALLGKDGSSASGAGSIEFPNGLPPPPPRNKKEKLTEVEQQLKKTEAAERRRMQNEKAARESEAETIRKILGQDSSRKKREDKMKKRQEEIAQERAANAHMVTPNTVRMVMGPQGTVVTFSNDVGLPHIFDQKPCSYPPPREKCAGPSCTNPYKYRDSKSKLPLCSLKCYKVIHENMHAEAAC